MVQAMEVMPTRTRLGGMATLQAAMCYDTLSQGAKAEALYKKIRGHPSNEVAKRVGGRTDGRSAGRTDGRTRHGARPVDVERKADMV